MPQKSENPKPVNTQPSQSWLQRMFGSSQMTPEMLQGVNIAQGESPDLAQVQPYGFFSRWLMPSAQGYTSPGRTIYLNPQTMKGQTPQEVADTILHEQTHVGQMKKRGKGPIGELARQVGDIFTPYHQRQDEQEAYTAEYLRRKRMGRSQSAIPSSVTGEFYVPGVDRYPGVNIAPSKKVR